MHEAPTQSGSKILPANAYTKLKPGEEYQCIVPASDLRPEVSLWSVTLGLIMVVIFSAACVYMALRAGNAIEASIPIAILAIFFGKMKKVKSTILENVMVQSIGQAAGVVAAGASFVIPALYINKLPVTWWHILVACALGGFLGTVLIIPLRKYFVKDLHGELPFPEATAINEILVSGESASGSAGKILLIAFFLGAGFDFCVEALHLWNPRLNTTSMLGEVGVGMHGMGMEVSFMAIAALFGLGYIIGMRYASIIASGSVLAFLVIVPLIHFFGSHIGEFFYAGQLYQIPDFSSMFGGVEHSAHSAAAAGQSALDAQAAKDPETGGFFKGVQSLLAGLGLDLKRTQISSPSGIFGAFVKPIGIGAIAISGLIGIIRLGKIVVGSLSLGFKGFSKKAGAEVQVERTQQDMSPRNVLLIQLASTLAMGVLFFIVSSGSYGFGDSLKFGLVGMVVGFVLSFLFTPVAAQAIAIVGVNPVSGMTLITVVLAIGAMIVVGLKGPAGMSIALIIGTAVCTALSTSGALITDFKIGYWIGSTPRNQQMWKFVGVLLAAAVVAFVIPIMSKAYDFSNQDMLPAPQANMLAAVSKGLMLDAANQPWLLYGLGAVVAVLLYMAGVPMLAFALGMYLPLSINIAVLAGAFTAWVVSKTGATEAETRARTEQGILIASGMMAGAAIVGIIVAVLRLADVGAPIRYLAVGAKFYLKEGALHETYAGWYAGATGRVLGFAMIVSLGVVCFVLARMGARWLLRDAEPDDGGGDAGAGGDDGAEESKPPDGDAGGDGGEGADDDGDADDGGDKDDEKS
jgi:uncharacterized oligopeptide transporter (OPT) family protein